MTMMSLAVLFSVLTYTVYINTGAKPGGNIVYLKGGFNSYPKLMWGPNMDRGGKVGREADNVCTLLIVLEKAQSVQ